MISKLPLVISTFRFKNVLPKYTTHELDYIVIYFGDV